MSVENIYLGRERHSDVLSRLEPFDHEFFYGEDGGGVGYCAFKYQQKPGSAWVSATVSTSVTHYAKLSTRKLEHNISRCEEHGIDHALILGFFWKHNPQIFVLDSEAILETRSHITKGREYSVFKIDDMRDKDGILRIS